jgi:hypothetical protein
MLAANVVCVRAQFVLVAAFPAVSRSQLSLPCGQTADSPVIKQMTSGGSRIIDVRGPIGEDRVTA